MRERGRPAGSAFGLPRVPLDIHGAKDFADHLMGVGAVLGAHPLDHVGEGVPTGKDVGILREEAEGQVRLNAARAHQDAAATAQASRQGRSIAGQ